MSFFYFQAKYLLRNGSVYLDQEFKDIDIHITNQGLVSFDNDFVSDEVIDCTGLSILPGLIDPHVHLREPGFSYKETINSGTTAGAAGGFTTVFSMPNLNPVPDSLKNLNVQRDIIKKDAVIEVLPIGSITVGQKGAGFLSNMDEMAPYVVGFSDDGVGVQDEDLMRQAMIKAASLNKPLILHCEDNKELKPGHCVHEGLVSEKYNVVGINSASEYNEVIRDIKLSKETGCSIHICHVSTKESVDAIVEARKEGLNVTGEITVHHLILNEEDVKNHGNYKMNPPLRSKSDQYSLIRALQEGSIDIICTDHAPHSEQEKERGLTHSPFGIIGLEFAFSLIYTHLVNKGIIPLSQAIDAMSINVSRRFNLPDGSISEGAVANLCVYDLNQKHTLSLDDIKSISSNTPFLNTEVDCKHHMTFFKGKRVC